MTNLELVQQRLREAFPSALMEVVDTRGDDTHLALEVVSEVFQGKTRLECHQLVHTALHGLVGGRIHALSISAKAPV